MTNSDFSRRAGLRAIAAAAIGGSLTGWLARFAARVSAAESTKRPKSCILLWMDGGPSQTHTFAVPDKDPDYKTIPTAVSGIHISEHLPKLAACLGDMALLRTMSTGLNNHAPGQYLMHTGYRASVAINYPSLGAIVAKECGQLGTGLPSYVNLGSSSVPKSFQRAGALGADFAPMMLSGSSITDIRPPIAAREAARLELLQEVQTAEIDRFQAEQLRSHAASYRKAIDLMHATQTRAFDYKSEPREIQQLYGSGGFGVQCLQARRLVEAGVSFVEVNWGGWDHHGGAAEPVQKRSPELDQGFSALITDLKQCGLLDSTLIVWMGEFGRGPLAGIGGGNNGKKGAGHYAKCWTTVLAGAGLKGGQVVGKTTPDGVEVADRPISAGDFFATICRALDIDPTATYDAAGRPVPYAATGSKPIAELF
ncbi:MAG: DUF1501 domain-containing protein [Pirellulaceae bacterium]|nr:DUF1501 domain-containing protein [Pirellulaceae bacterium]